MTVTPAPTTRPVHDVRAARLRRRVCQAADRAGGTGLRRPGSPPITRAVVVGGRTVSRGATRQRRTTVAALALAPFELQ
jgi:hypothetical protein